MAGEKNLENLLHSMSPVLTEGDYVFCTLKNSNYGDYADARPIASFTEAEGLTLVLLKDAAESFGLSYEGVFRQMSISKGKNRNTAWFAAIDKEWAAIKAAFEAYLSEDNFDENQQPKISLSSLTKPMLFKIDNKEFTWTGKIVNVKGGWFSSEVYAACDNRSLYRGFNAILVTSEKDKAAKFKVGEKVKFKGMVYSYRPKRDGVIIMYMSGVKFLTDSPKEVSDAPNP